MSLRTKGLVLAMEEEEVVIPSGSEEITEALAETSDSADEVEGIASDVEELEGSVDDAAQDAETLEKIHDTMEESVEKGEGLDETAAEIAEVAIESICLRLGIHKRAMPAMESFGSTNSRLTATKIAMENIQDFIASTWKAIVAAWNKMWDYIKSFFEKYFTALGKAKEVAKQLETSVKAFDKTEKTKEELDNASLAGLFTVSGKADAATVEAILKNHTGYTSGLVSAADILREGVKNYKAGETPTTSELATKYVTKVSAVSPELVGGAVIKVEAPKEEGKGFSLSFNVTIGGEKAAAAKLPVLSKAEMEAILGEVVSLLSVSESFKKEMKSVEEINKAVIDLAKSFGNLRAVAKGEGATAEEQAKAKESSKEAAALVKGVQAAINKTTTTVPSLNLKAANGALSYVNASLKAYK